MKKIYLSGPITGMSIEVARDRFEKYEKHVRDIYPDAEICNPLKFTHYEEGKQWQDYMHECLAVLEQCDTIIMLPAWEVSNGARCEMYYARGMKLEVIFYSDTIAPKAWARDLAAFSTKSKQKGS